MKNWIDVNKALPQVGDVVLVCIRKYSDFARGDMYGYSIAIFWGVGDWSCPDSGKQIEPTFWRNIPDIF